MDADCKKDENEICIMYSDGQLLKMLLNTIYSLSNDIVVGEHLRQYHFSNS